MNPIDAGTARRTRPGGMPDRRAMLCAVLAVLSLLLVGSSPEELTRRRQLIEAMSPEQKAELAEKQKRFANLTPKEQKRLRDFHERLQAEPDAEELREVMRRYCDWLDTLIPYTRNAVRQLPVDERVARIKKERSWAQDARALRRFWGSYPRRPGPAQWRQWQKQARSARGPRGRRDQAARLLAEYLQLETADLSTLRDQLSRPTAKRFDKMSGEAQRRWVAHRLLDMVRRQMWTRRPGGPAADVSNEQLAEFFESGPLGDEARDALLRLPGKEMYEKLRRHYRVKDFSRPQGARTPGRKPERKPSSPWFGSPTKRAHQPADRTQRAKRHGPGGMGPDEPPRRDDG